MSWRDQARCLRVGPWIFDYETETDQQLVDNAKKVCGRCPVQAECLAAALDGDEVGIWGGTTTRERAAMKPARAATKRGGRPPLGTAQVILDDLALGIPPADIIADLGITPGGADHALRRAGHGDLANLFNRLRRAAS